MSVQRHSKDLVPTVDPSTERPLRILGTGFTNAAEVVLNGLVLQDFYFTRSGNSFINIDMPPLPIGQFQLGLRDILWLMVVCGILLSWWHDRKQLTEAADTSAKEAEQASAKEAEDRRAEDARLREPSS